MFSAADLIHALQRKLQLIAPHLRRKPGEFPPGWQAWFDSMRERVGAVRGATPDAIVAVFLQRPLASRPRRLGDLTRWQAFSALMRQDWPHASDRWDKYDRRTHWFAATFTIFWHILFSALLLYLMYLRFMAVSAPPPQGEEVTMIEYIGTGTPKEPGGGASEPTQQPGATPAPAAPAPAPAQPDTAQAQPAPTQPPTPAVPSPPVPPVDAPLPEIAQRDVPEPQLPPPAPVVEQAVTVSEPVPDAPQVFVLPPTRRLPPEAAIAAPELSAPTPSVRTTEVAEPVQPIRREITPREIAVPTIEQRTREITQREVPAPLPRVPVRALPEPTVPVPQVRTTEQTVRTRDVPAPPTTAPIATAPSTAPSTATPASTPSASTTPSTAPSTAPATSAAAAAPRAAPSGTAPGTTGRGSQPSTAGAGPRPTPAPGTWSTPQRGDDWGASTRNAPGGQRGVTPGLYNADGSLRVPEATGSASPPQPPGAITEEIRDLDRAGTWLKRKPTDFEPTSFDKYWVPDETLLAEWVRKGIQKVTIPIPGTNKRIECVVSMLGLGGGCGLSDPNLNDQPAEARPPPDIPFKPALQEDNGSVKP